MTTVLFLGALEIGLIYALVALGVLISFRILDFPDLTADGSFPLGGAVCAVCIINGVNPWLATVLATLAGAMAGFVTAWLHVSLKILQLLASILVMLALYSVNLRIMGSPNVSLLGEPIIYDTWAGDNFEALRYWQPLIALGFVIVGKLFLDWFFNTQTGLAVRATGANIRMAKAQGIATGNMVYLGMAISNGLIALGGALYVQSQGGVDMSIGVGTIVIGLAAVIIGETLIPSKNIVVITLAVVIGSILYRFFIAIALSSDTLREIGFRAQDLNLVTALLVVLVLVAPQIKAKMLARGKGVE
ncbi:ABC transporter permease [Pasteurellaceae bacterium TAE3-ERU1]|uniref:ABC transporter permease n=1 Tax=Spirabiliibacterium mucosae TaxID=28156 RepID=UPI001AADE2C5|nr:ABC transporter permease [Spirabiliibacterium mucosae]MBE2899137.1 ABC transporter permease [Spirabiliibacterium mucosae]MBV7388955.1 ABC transporter permease [Pasteurellaceae bacterium TAE3-ERU1]